MKNLTKFFTLAILYTILGSTYAHASESIEVTNACQFSKHSKDYVLSFKATDAKASWYNVKMKLYTLYFTNENDCEDQLNIISNSSRLKNTTICACSTAAKADALFLGGQFWGFSRVSCVKFVDKNNHSLVVRGKQIIRDGWLDLSYESQSSADLSDYFDENEREGQNYDLCKEQIPTLIKKL